MGKEMAMDDSAPRGNEKERESERKRESEWEREEERDMKRLIWGREGESVKESVALATSCNKK